MTLWPLPFKPVFEWMATLPGSQAMREAELAFPINLTLHVWAMCAFLGLIFMMDLRLMGVAHRRISIPDIQKRLFPWQMLGFTVMVITGLLMFYADPVRYWGKLFFWIKLLTIGLAGLNMLVFHVTTYKTVADWETDPVPPLGARLAGALSIVLWLTVLSLGRLVAYDWWTQLI